MNSNYLSALPETSPMAASGVKMALWAEWRLRWAHRIGQFARSAYTGNGPCSVCGHRNTMFSIGEWRCGKHLWSLVG